VTEATVPGRRRTFWVATVAALAGYLLTLAPTVTLWDSGEFLAATRGLGIPHPPGTPLFILLAHTWAALLPLGSYAWRVNLLAAVAGAVTAGCLAVVIHEALRRTWPARAAEAAAAGAAMVAAFTFTQWQNANETEVYAVATALIGVVAWLALHWRERRGTSAAPRALLLIVYLLALSVGNHLLALLAGPAVLTLLGHTLHAAPAADPAERRGEWAELGVVAGAWALLVGVGLGDGALAAIGAAAFVAAAGYAVVQRRAGFAALAGFAAVVGVSTYLFLLIRAGQHPAINEAAPDTWARMLDVVRRAQYPVRTPFDDPTVAHGPLNPGRSLALVGMQLANYAQYFTWQWGRALPDVARAVVAVAFLSLGARGALRHRTLDRGGWWFLAALWLVTGLGLVAYMNFKPGASQFYGRFPDPADHEVRERDYFFVVSFVVWGLWAGMELAVRAREWWRAGRGARALAVGCGALALVPLAANWPAATRRGPDQTLARDVAWDLLNSVGPYGILVTYGDNDTFPLWYLQEVEGVRRDVSVVCLALANTDWYLRQLRDRPASPFDRAAAPAVWRDAPATPPDRPLHAMTDAEIAAIAGRLIPVDRDQPITLGPIQHVIPAGARLLPSQYALLRIIQQNLGRRPIAWSVTAGREFLGLDRYVVLQGLAFRLEPSVLDTTAAEFGGGPVGGVLVDVALTAKLARETYRYGGLDGVPLDHFEPAAAGLAMDLALPYTYLAGAAQHRGDTAAAVRDLRAALRIAPSPDLAATLATLEVR
jgi:hypothetical protein